MSEPEGEPVPLASSVDAVVRDLGGRASVEIGAVFRAWDDVVGAAVAAHAAPSVLDGSRLIVVVDEPAWATEIRFLGAAIAGRLNAALARVAVTEIDVRVGPPQRPRWRGEEGPSW
jgi:predicted nucleic acid-binding Zn ribbon protein